MAAEVSVPPSMDKAGGMVHVSADIQADSLGRNDDGSVPLMSTSDLHQMLVAIDDEIGGEELQALKFMCRDYISGN